MTGATWRIGVLGPLVLERNGQPVGLPRGRPRALLAVLLAAGGPLSRDRLIDELWGECPPASAVSMLHVYLSKLRALLGELLVSGPAGYALAPDGFELDAREFDTLVEQAREDSERSGAVLGGALELFRGEPLCDVACERSVAEWRRILEDKRWQATLARIDALLDAGADGDLLGELEGLAREHPLDERLAGQLMLALYRAERQADALDCYRRIRTRLAEELGLDPGPALQSRHQLILEQAASLARPDRAAGAVRASDLAQLRVPALATPTIGREDALEDVLSLLERQEVRIVTLVGPGGVGKTRLALLAAHAAAPSCADGACWIELAGVARADDVPSTIARGLGVTPAGSETSEHALCRYLAAKQLLLVLDTFEHVIDSAGLVAELHRNCPELILLVTSREALDLSAEHRYLVAPLMLPDPGEMLTVDDVEATPSTAMFLAAARRRDHRFSIEPADVPAVARICTRLEGLPLAIELAAARTSTIDVEQLAIDLESELDNLGTGPRDAAVRHRTLEAAIQWSFNLLDPDLQTVFTRFAVFAGGATLSAAQTITRAGGGALEALVAKSMIERRTEPGDGARLVMLDTLRQFARRELASQPDEADLRHRHLEYYLNVAEQADAQLATRHRLRGLSVLDRETENLHAAREWALQHDPDLCLRLTGQLGSYWGMRRNPGALGWCDAALSAAGDRAPLLDRARAEHRRARLLSLLHRPEAAIAAAKVALSLYQDAGDPSGIANSLCSLALDTGALTGDLEQERQYAESAVRHAKLGGDERVLALALSEWAEAAEGDDRRPRLEEAAVVLTRLGNNRGLTKLYSNTAYVALTEGRVDEANELLERALEVPGVGDDPWRLAGILGNLGLSRLFAGEPRAARAAFADALRHFTTNGFDDDIGESLAGLAAIAAIEGDLEVAARLRGAVRTAGYPPGEFDRQVDQRLILDYMAAAQERLGPAAWTRGEEIGAAWTPAEATACALAWACADAGAESEVVAGLLHAAGHGAGGPQRR